MLTTPVARFSFTTQIITFGILFLIKNLVPPEPMWSLDRQRETGELFWKRDSSRVKFRDEVEVLEFVRDPEELKFMMECEYGSNTSHPFIAITTVVLTIAITVVLPWVYLGSNGIQ